VTAWDAGLAPSETEIEEDLRKDILGARKKLLFVEGTERSLDKPLYSLVFPNVSVIAKLSCRDVEHSVTGIRDAANLHWLHAFGIVDNDQRTKADVDKLKEKGIYALSVFSVESIYYHPEVQRRVAERYAAVTGEEASTRVENAKLAAIAVIKPHIQRLSERTVEKAIREEIYRHLPGRHKIAATEPINISIDSTAIVNSEKARLEEALDAGELLAIITRYPVRETAALTQIASKL
jgi:hypothetical protein